jgi:hypothetical protein
MQHLASASDAKQSTSLVHSIPLGFLLLRLVLLLWSCACVLCRWHDAPSQTINFITEYFTSGTLRQ